MTRQPPEAQHARLMALAERYDRMAQRMVGKTRAIAEEAADTAREMAGEVWGLTEREGEAA